MAQPFCLLLMLALMVPFLAAIRPYKVIADEYESQTSYTIDLDLPTHGILSSLILKLKARTLTTGVSSCPWAKYLISSVSVNQAGQAFLNAAPPEVFQADSYYKTGRMPTRGYNEWRGSNAEVIEEIPILFGESLIDLDHTIDLSKLNDPKLSVTYDLDTTDIAAQSIWDTSYYPRFSVIAYLLQGAGIPASKGYHSLRQIDQYTPTDSEEHKTELKGARPIKRILAQLDLSSAGFDWWHSITEAKLWGDNEAYVPFSMNIVDWYEVIRDIYGLCEVKAGVYYILGNSYMDSCVDKPVYMNGSAQRNGEHILRPTYGSGRSMLMTTRLISDGSAPATVMEGVVHFAGYCPFSIAIIDMEKMLGMDYLDPKEKAPIFLELDHVSNAATIGGPVKIHVSDLVKP